MRKIIILASITVLATTITSFVSWKEIGMRLEPVTYTGTIDKLPITMYISNVDAKTGNISGYYNYNEKSTNITLTGNSKRNGITNLTEMVNTKITGKFTGKYSCQHNSDACSYDGTWKSPDGKESYKFTVSPEMGDE